MKTHDHQYFYKYVTADVAKIILETLKVKVSSPFLFNDPFDSQISLRYEAADDKEIAKKIIIRGFQVVAPYIKKGQEEAALSLILEKNLNNNFVTNQVKILDDIFKELNECVRGFLREDRIFCVSEKYDNLLMWAHYTDNHKGAVIRLKCMPELNTASCVAKQVQYEKEVPIISLDDMLKPNKIELSRKILHEILLTKSIDWSYEKEWRWILGKTGNGYFDLRLMHEKEFDAIYLGCQMENSVKQDLISLVNERRNHMLIYQAQKDSCEFKLNFELVKN